MGATAANYKPSLKNVNKYSVYLKYLKDYLLCGDLQSAVASLKYLFTHKLPDKDYLATSKMGVFNIRKGTTDFQFINYTYESKIKDFITEHIEEFDVFIDVGACIGEYCIWLAKKGKHCVAIEPVNYEAIKKNISLNKVNDNVQVFECGLGSKKERVYFNIPKGITSSSHIAREVNKEPNVDIETLDDLLKEIKLSPSDRVLMKLDVEGMETDVIEGGQNFIKNHKKIMVIYEHFKEHNFKNDNALLSLARFKIKDIDGVNRVAIKEETY